MLTNSQGSNTSAQVQLRSARLLSIIPDSDNTQLFQIRADTGLSSDYINPINAVAVSLAWIQHCLRQGNAIEPEDLEILCRSVKDVPTYTDFVIDRLLPRARGSGSEAVRNLTRSDFIEVNREGVRRLDELAGLMKYAVRQSEDRVAVFVSTIADLGREMILILTGSEPAAFVKLDLTSLTLALLKDGGVRVGTPPGKS